MPQAALIHAAQSDMREEARKRRLDRMQMIQHPLPAVFLAEHVTISVYRVRIRHDDWRFEFEHLRIFLRYGTNPDSLRFAVSVVISRLPRTENLSAQRGEGTAQIVGELLRAAFRIVVTRK